MNYNQWFRETFSSLVRARLWVLVAPWFLLLWLIGALGGGIAVGWEARIRHLMANPEFLGTLSQVETFGQVVRILPRVLYEMLGIRFYVFLIALALSFLLWVLRWVYTGAVIHHAMPVHERPPRLEASLHTGIRYAPCVFLINVLFFLLSLVLLLPLLGIFFLVFGIAFHPSSADTGAFLGLVLVGGVCFFLPLLIVAGFLVGLYKNLVYQACVQESLGVGAALTRAWGVLRHRPGPALILGISAAFLGGIAGLVQSTISQTWQILPATQGSGAIVGMVFWAFLAGVAALLAVLKELVVLLLYTKAWPDIARQEQGEGEAV